MVEKIIFYVLTFFLYSAVGWFFESCYCSVRPRKWVNRGFLYGPMCPIYGSGAVMLSLALGKFSKLPIYRHGWYLTPVLTFLLGALLADVLEFLTSLVMEKLFHARWWDYSQKKFNIQGRICLTHTLYWGAATLIFLYFIDPKVSALLWSVPALARTIITCVIFAVFLVDLVLTVKKTADLRKLTVKIDALTRELNKFKTETSEKAKGLSAEIREQLDASIESGRKLLQQNKIAAQLTEKAQQGKEKMIRFFRVNPGLRRRVTDKLDELKELMERYH
ncbi:MAG: hypothetical protein IJU96_11560 [Clostridia bacterium]|nr:hypothetical protein [Clostridia bacterium]